MKDKTLIVVVLDKSGSMASMKRDVVASYNKFLSEQQELPGEADITLIQFNESYNICYENKPVKECPPICCESSYFPVGSTALNDAIGKTFNLVGQHLNSLPEEERPSKVLMNIITDGEENCSTEFSQEKIKEMIDHQTTKYNWKITFIASGLRDDYAQVSYNLMKSSTANFSHDSSGIKSAMDTMSSYAADYRTRGFTDDLSSYIKTEG